MRTVTWLESFWSALINGTNVSSKTASASSAKAPLAHLTETIVYGLPTALRGVSQSYPHFISNENILRSGTTGCPTHVYTLIH